jgi:hypothetical protein
MPGAKLLAPITMLRLDNFQPSNRVPNYVGLAELLKNVHAHAGLHKLLDAISTMADHRTFRVCYGDVNAMHMPVEQRHHTDISATILANTLAALKFSTVGADSDEPRFPMVPGLEGQQEPYRHGFHVDSWLGMITGGINAFHYRRHPSAGAKYKIDGNVGNTKPLSGLAYVSADQLTGIVTKQEREQISVKTGLHLAFDYLEEIHKLETVSDSEPDAAVTTESLNLRLERRMTNRLEYICNSSRYVESMTAQALGKKNNTGKGFPRMLPLPPMNQNILNMVLRSVARFHQTPREHGTDIDSVRALQHFVTDTDGSLHSFLAGQESLAENLASIREKFNGSDSVQARDEVNRCMKHSWTVGKMLNRTPPVKVDFSLVLEAFDLDPRRPQRQHLKLNPVGNCEFTCMHHQLVDAYIMWQHEQSVIHGSILANDVGTGKTITAMSLVVLDYRHIVRQARAGKEFQARPTLMVVPAGLIGQTFNEINKYFGGLIDLKCYYGVKAEFKGARAASTLTKAEWEEEMAYTMNPETIESKPKVYS